MLAFSFALVAAPVFASECPPVADRSTEVSDIIRQLTFAPGPAAASQWNQKLWEIWLDAPDDLAQTFLNNGMAEARYANFTSAIINFDALIKYCPDYAEGYNQRAYAFFLQAKFEPALADLERALELRPRHIGALSGKALTLMGLKRDDEAQDALRAALELNPWLSERRFLKDGPKEPGTKL